MSRNLKLSSVVSEEDSVGFICHCTLEEAMASGPEEVATTPQAEELHIQLCRKTVDIVLKYACHRNALKKLFTKAEGRAGGLHGLLVASVHLLLDQRDREARTRLLWSVWLPILVHIPFVPEIGQELNKALTGCHMRVEDVMRDTDSLQMVCIAEQLEMQRLASTTAPSSSTGVLELLRDQIRTHGHALVLGVLDCLVRCTTYKELALGIIRSEILPAIQDNCVEEDSFVYLKCLVCNCLSLIVEPEIETNREDIARLLGQVDVELMNRIHTAGHLDSMFSVISGMSRFAVKSSSSSTDDDDDCPFYSGVEPSDDEESVDDHPKSPSPEPSLLRDLEELPAPTVPPASGAGTDDA